MKKNALFISLLLCISFCYSQKTELDSIPFSLEKQLLTFSGKLNGKNIELAFDTGAGITVTNSINNTIAGVQILSSDNTVNDSSQKKIKIKNTKIESISIGKFEVKSIKGVTFDMPFLYCSDLLLLGQDFIKQFNWKIDFRKKLIYISKKTFQTDNSFKKWNIYYSGKRPLVDFTINDKTYKNCLIDTGFSGIMEINSKEIEIVNKIFEEKKSQNKADEFISTNMGLSGLGNPEPFNTFFIDNIKLDQTTISQLPVTINKTTETKIGINFFSQYSDILILNFDENSFFIKTSDRSLVAKKKMDAKILIVDGKITVISKNLNANSSAKTLNVGENIKTFNNKKASEITECDLLKWSYFYNEDYILEKENGQKVEIKSNSNIN